MFPIVAIGGVIGAVFSIAKGASWLVDQLDSAKAGASAGGKPEPKTAAGAKPSQFEAALAAQVAGQKTPVATTTASGLPPLGGPDYNTLARMKAGLFAYSHVGEHRDGHGKDSQAASESRPLSPS
jgi:hypothetical protein